MKGQSFTSVTVETPAALADEAAGVFAAFGALGCEIGKASHGLDPKRPSRSRVHAYFERLTQTAIQRITRLLGEAGMLAEGFATPVVSRIEDPGWAKMWQRRFEPLPIGQHLIIVPPWRRIAGNGRTPIIIRPGQAFGTGHHPSTAGVLRLLEQLFDSRRFARALDVGTGSGILAIAMRKLGAGAVTAIDFDAIALENARENADLNRVGEVIRLSAAPLNSIRGRFDLITANIITPTLIDMAARLKRRLRAGGYLILAGILARETDAVVAAYAPELKLHNVSSDRSWRALLLQG